MHQHGIAAIQSLTVTQPYLTQRCTTIDTKYSSHMNWQGPYALTDIHLSPVRLWETHSQCVCRDKQAFMVTFTFQNHATKEEILVVILLSFLNPLLILF